MEPRTERAASAPHIHTIPSAMSMLPVLAGSEAQAATDTRREIIALDEGDVVITFPASLTAQSFEDLDAHLKLFLRKMQRRAKAARRDLGEISEDNEETSDPDGKRLIG